MRYVTAFRTYTWDDGVAELARRFFAATPAARQVVLADETRGPLGITGYEVISHTEDTSNLGLLVYPAGNSLWYNVDYGLYILRAALPGYDYYLTSEADLAVNTPLDAIVRTVAGRQTDIVAHWLRPATPDWEWYATAAGMFEQPMGSLLFFMILSARAIDLLFYMRSALTVELQAGRIDSWPFCEIFVPSLLRQAGMSFLEIGEFADTENLRLRPRILLTDASANRPGSLVHSVLARPAYIRAIIKEYPPRDWLAPESEMRRALRDIPVAEYAALLCEAFAQAGDDAGLAQFMTVSQSVPPGWVMPPKTSI
jgi:hypothetical protein